MVILIIGMRAEDAWPSLDLLHDLDVLLEERHVTRAAKRRGITQSAMSARLAKLRSFFADPLLVDARPHLLRTARAESLRLPLRLALGQLSDVISQSKPFDPHTSTHTFVLVGNDIAEAIVVPGLLARFQQRAPGVKLQMRRATTDLRSELGEGGGDLALEPMSAASDALHSFPIMQDSFVVLMRQGHPLQGKRMTLAAYLRYPHVLVSPGGRPGGAVDDALARLGKQRTVVAVLRHFVTAPIVVARSDALLTCPASLASAVADLMPLHSVVPPPPLSLPANPLGAIWHERSHHDPAHLWLRSQVRALTTRS